MRAGRQQLGDGVGQRLPGRIVDVGKAPEGVVVDAATRIAAIENYAHTQVAIQVRRLEQRLVEATSSDGDWRLALLGIAGGIAVALVMGRLVDHVGGQSTSSRS